MKKKIILITVIVLIVFLVGLIILSKNTDNIKLKDNQFIFELGEDISAEASYYLEDADSTKNIKDYKLSSKELKIIDNKFVSHDSEFINVDEYDIDLIYKKTSKKFVIKVVDTTSPEFIKFKEELEFEQDSDISNIEANFEATDLTNVEIKIDGEYDVSKVGEYKITVVATDENGNSINKESLIKITKKEEPTKEAESNNTNKQQSSNQVSQSSTSQSITSSNSGNSNPTANNSETTSPRYRKDVSDLYVRQLNEYRKANGLSELPVTTETQAEADRRSKELSTYYSHDGVAYGFGENIGEGSVGADFFTAWKNSPPHNAAMLREQNTAVAASVYEVNNHWYAVISFKMNY